MQTPMQTAKAARRATKRRNRNKRRRLKMRLLRRAQKTGTEVKKLIEPRKLVSHQTDKWEALCLKTYQRLTAWQCEAELNFWKARAEHLQKENKHLKEQLERLARREESEAYSEEKQDQTDVDCEADPAYLEFIAITHKHREDLRQARQNKVAVVKDEGEV